MRKNQFIIAGFLFTLVSAMAWLRAADEPKKEEGKKGEAKAVKVELADGKLTMTMPKEWEQKKPSNNIIPPTKCTGIT